MFLVSEVLFRDLPTFSIFSPDPFFFLNQHLYVDTKMLITKTYLIHLSSPYQRTLYGGDKEMVEYVNR